MKKILLSLFVAMSLISCENKMSMKKIHEIESQMFAENAEPDKELGVKLVDAYVLYARQNPKDELAPDILFKALDASVNFNTDNPQKTIEIADEIIDNYPEYFNTPMAMLIKGFVYENIIVDLPKAELTYRHFLEKYPDNPMAGDVRTIIENLGIPLDKLIETFEE